MSGVGVLAVLADLASSCSDCSGQGQRPIGEPYIDNGYVVDLEACQECADIHEARAAVSELIEVAAGIEGLARLAAAPLRDYKAAVDRLTAALSRVRGAA